MSTYRIEHHPIRGARAFVAARDVVVGDKVADLLGGPCSNTARRGWLVVEAPLKDGRIGVVSHERDAWGQPSHAALTLIGPDDVIEIAPREEP